MSCCPYDIVPFFNVPVSVIGYSPAMKALYGPEPKVSVYYQDPDTFEWYMVNGIMGTEVKYDPTLSEILIDHGGVLTGYVKIQ